MKNRGCDTAIVEAHRIGYLIMKKKKKKKKEEEKMKKRSVLYSVRYIYAHE